MGISAWRGWWPGRTGLLFVFEQADRLRSGSAGRGLIDLIVTTGTYAQNQDDLGTADAVDDAYIARSNSAVAGQRTSKGLTDLVGFSLSETLADHPQDSSRFSGAQLFEVFFYRGVELNAPGHCWMPR